MPRRGSAPIRYVGKRGVVWRIKYRDADGVQVQETLGREADGWTERKARRELKVREVDVEREGLRRPKRITFAVLAREWCDGHESEVKRSSGRGYRSIIERHLLPELGHLRPEQVTVAEVERYVRAKRKRGMRARTLHNHLNVLRQVLAAAQRRGLVRENPVRLVQRPRDTRKGKGWRILQPVEIGRIQRAFAELAREAAGEEQAWLEQARVIFLTLVGTGLRRGEVLGLHWRDVRLADPEGAVLEVRETWVRSGWDTPKSEAGARTIPLMGELGGELLDHRGRSPFQGDDELVFHSTTGRPFDVQRYKAAFEAALARARVERREGIRPFHDMRHTALTRAAAAGVPPMVLKHLAGHSSFATTQEYIDLAGVVFRNEAAAWQSHVFGQMGTKSGYKAADALPQEQTA
jgi:integrase